MILASFYTHLRGLKVVLSPAKYSYRQLRVTPISNQGTLLVSAPPPSPLELVYTKPKGYSKAQSASFGKCLCKSLEVIVRNSGRYQWSQTVSHGTEPLEHP
jgi:hypothetical protein